MLLVDATQGIEAQTLSNLYMAIDHDLAIIPVLNKIDLPSAEPDKHAEEIAGLIGCDPSDVLRVSGKTGEGVAELLDRIVAEVPAPTGNPDAPARALIFDSVYDSYRGIVTYIRMVDGELKSREKLHMMGIGMTHDPIEIGAISPDMMPTKALGAGEVGYAITGAKDVSQSKVGDTITSAINPATEPLEGYRDRNQWSTPACSQSTTRNIRNCARRLTSSSSTTRPSSTNRKPPWRWASAFVAASWACCTWRSSPNV